MTDDIGLFNRSLIPDSNAIILHSRSSTRASLDATSVLSCSRATIIASLDETSKVRAYSRATILASLDETSKLRACSYAAILASLDANSGLGDTIVGMSNTPTTTLFSSSTTQQLSTMARPSPTLQTAAWLCGRTLLFTPPTTQWQPQPQLQLQPQR